MLRLYNISNIQFFTKYFKQVPMVKKSRMSNTVLYSSLWDKKLFEFGECWCAWDTSWDLLTDTRNTLHSLRLARSDNDFFLEYKSSNIYIGAALWLMMTGSVSVLISLNPSLIISGSHKNILCHYIVISIIPNTPDITKRALIYIQQSRCHIASLCTICTIKNIFCQNCQNLRNI